MFIRDISLCLRNFRNLILKISLSVVLFLTTLLFIFIIFANTEYKGELNNIKLIAESKAGYVYKADIASKNFFKPGILYNLSKATFVNEPDYVINDGYFIEFDNTPKWYDSNIVRISSKEDGGFISETSTDFQANGYDFIVPTVKGDIYKIEINARRLSGAGGAIYWYLDDANGYKKIEGSETMFSNYMIFEDVRDIAIVGTKKYPNLHFSFPKGEIEIKSIKLYRMGDNSLLNLGKEVVFTSSEILDNVEMAIDIVYKLSINKYIIVFISALFLLLFILIIYYNYSIINSLITKRIFILFTFIFATFLLSFQFYIGFPGYFQNNDNYNIMCQAILGEYSNWHPVIIPLSLSLLYSIFGYHTFYLFLINLICWYLGLSLIIISLYLKYNKKIFFLLFTLTFIGNIFFQNFTELKDITMGMYLWLSLSLLLFQFLVPVRKYFFNISLKIFTGFILLLALLWRHNAIVTVYPLFILFTYLFLKCIKFRNLKSYLCVFISLMLLFAFLLSFFVKVYPYIWIEKEKMKTSSSGVYNSVFLLQIISCSVLSDDDSLIPKYWYEDNKTFEELKARYKENPLSIDNIAMEWSSDRVIKYGYLKDLNLVWIKSMLRHPISYVKSILGFVKAFWFNSNGGYWILNSNILQELRDYKECDVYILSKFTLNERRVSLSPMRYRVYNFLFSMMPVFNTFVGVGTSILLFFITGFLLITGKSLRSSLLVFAFSTSFSGFMTATIVVLFSPADDIRYIAPVLPISIISLISFLVFLCENNIFIRLKNIIMSREKK